MLRSGNWNGRQIVPAAWVGRALARSRASTG